MRKDIRYRHITGTVVTAVQYKGKSLTPILAEWGWTKDWWHRIEGDEIIFSVGKYKISKKKVMYEIKGIRGETQVLMPGSWVICDCTFAVIVIISDTLFKREYKKL